MFLDSVTKILSSWKALQFCVTQQTGGAQSQAIALWMNGVTEQFFYENEDLEPEEVAEFLGKIMDEELHTHVDDGSDLEISNILCQVYRFHKVGNLICIEEILSKLPNQNSTFEEKIQLESDEEIEPCELVSSQISSLSISESEQHAHMTLEENPSMEFSLEEKQQMADQLDGWTVIKKERRRKK